MQEHVLETTKQSAEQTSNVTSSPAIFWPGFGLASSSWFCGGVEAASVARRRLLEQLKFSSAGSCGTRSPWSAISNLQLVAWSTDWHHSFYHISFYTCEVRPLRIGDIIIIIIIIIIIFIIKRSYSLLNLISNHCDALMFFFNSTNLHEIFLIVVERLAKPFISWSFIVNLILRIC